MESENTTQTCTQTHVLPQEVSFNWKDVTQLFHSATDELCSGELLHDSLFGLFEAMSAIEMMDPKMDAGMLCNKTNKKVLNFEQSLKVGRLKIDNFRYEEQIAIIDDTFGCFVTWLEGHSLAQTVFINLYLHNPNQITNKPIKMFCIVILKLIDIIREFVSKANVFEEEDFQPIIYGYQLACDISDAKACTSIREVEDELYKKIKNMHRSVNESNQTQNEFHNDYQTSQLVNALLIRLRFTRLLFQLLLTLKREIINKNNKKNPVNTNIYEDIEKILNQCNGLLQGWSESISYGIQADSSSSSSTHGHRADYPTIMGFEPLVNQRLLPPTFPRYTKMKTRTEAVEYLTHLIDRLKRVCKIYECASYHSALEFFNDFSKNIPSSCVLSRSILQVLYLPNPNVVFGTYAMSEVIREACKLFIKPPSLCTKSAFINNNPQSKDLLENFFNRCIRPMATLTQICGHNRARQREKLAQVLEELAVLQEEAEKIDSNLNNFTQKTEPQCSHIGYYSTWVLYHILRVMIQYLLSGFELELYAPHEYPYIFWYLYEFLFGWMVSTLNRASNLILEQESIAEQIQQQQQKGRTNKKLKPKKRKQRPHYQEILLYQSLQHLNSGLYKTICAFKMDGKLKLPWSGLNTEQIRYEHRFIPFRNILAPPPVSYMQYKEMTADRFAQQSSTDLYLMACKSFQQSKALLEAISDKSEEISAYLKIAKTNFIVIKLLSSGHERDLKSFPEYDFSIHQNYPIIRIYKK